MLILIIDCTTQLIRKIKQAVAHNDSLIIPLCNFINVSEETREARFCDIGDVGR